MAYTEHYVNITPGVSNGDGNSAGSPYNLAGFITAFNASAAGNHRYNVCGDNSSSPYASNISLTSKSGSYTNGFIVIRGWSGSGSNYDDGYLGRSNSGAGDLITTNMPNLCLTTGNLTFGNYVEIQNLRISSAYSPASTSAGVLSLGTYCICYSLVINNTTNPAVTSYEIAAFLGIGSSIINCDLYVSDYNCYAGAYSTGANTRFIGCRFHSNAYGIASSSGIIYGNTIINPYIGILSNGSTTIINNTIVGCTSGAAIWISSGIANLILNNQLTGNPIGITENYSPATSNCCFYNNFQNNTSGATSSGNAYVTNQGIGNIIGSQANAADYVNAAASDYRLLSTSTGKGAAIGGYDCGALQRAEPILPSTSDVWYGVTSWGELGAATGAKRASTITNCTAGNVKKDVAIDNVTGSYTGSGGGGKIIG